jgi:hypothetical protein
MSPILAFVTPGVVRLLPLDHHTTPAAALLFVNHKRAHLPLRAGPLESSTLSFVSLATHRKAFQKKKKKTPRQEDNEPDDSD